ncbi:hypothetical protein TNCV_635671 [Trichonephila clavipes]|nr:hypothetical protein TNCV_635671 [Trichonephila clavipes]
MDSWPQTVDHSRGVYLNHQPTGPQPRRTCLRRLRRKEFLFGRVVKDENKSRVTVPTESQLITEEMMEIIEPQDSCSRHHARRPFRGSQLKRYRLQGTWHTNHLR